MNTESLSAAKIATLVITEALGKASEELGKEAFKQSVKLFNLLRERFSSTAKAIEQAKEKRELVPEAIQALEEAAKEDPQIAKAVQAVADAVKAQPQGNKSITNLAEEIKIINSAQGDINIDGQTIYI